MSQIRRSQFLTTYGPGAIIEGTSGPRIILSPELSGAFQINLSPFEITEQRLSQGLLEGAGILRLPSNAELGKPENEILYKTKRFPSWSLCTKHGILYHKVTDNVTACPKCGPLVDKWEAWRFASRQAIRFVRACPAGHLDDVDWVGMIPHQKQNCKPDYLLWQGSGALKNITIECPVCRGKVNLGLAYSRSWPCSGRFPEREADEAGPQRLGCNEEARIIQRGAANLRIPEIETALIIPQCDTNLHRLLQISDIHTALASQLTPVRSKDDVLKILRSLDKRGKVEQSVINEIDQYDQEEILQAINDILHLNIPQSAYEMRRQEFVALLNAASNGYPPEPPKYPGDVPRFEVHKDEVRLVTWNNLPLRVTPVSRLTVLMVQRGYKRIPAGRTAASRTVSTVFELSSEPGRKWYIGSELSGEGIFLDLNLAQGSGNPLRLDGETAHRWRRAWDNPQVYLGNNLFQSDRHQFHPVFVWWHTLSHRLINALSVDSGYSSASIRERIFLDVDNETGEASGGLLLYTAQPGGDGTLGGLIALVPEFERVLERALYNLDSCSNDPLCGEEEFGPQKYNGAACYACALISETSCEHRNMSLDRKLLLEGWL